MRKHVLILGALMLALAACSSGASTSSTTSGVQEITRSEEL